MRRPGRRHDSPTALTRAVGALASAAARASGADVVTLDAPPGSAGPALRVCAGAGRLAPCARGGTTWGEVFVTRQPLASVRAPVVRHELVHVRQWRRWGALFPVLYLLSELGGGPLRNRFEQQAGLHDGGYVR